MKDHERTLYRCLIEAALEPAEQDGEMPKYIGQYQLISELGRGGLGIVYRALQADLKREVAVKAILDDDLDGPAAIERFRRESEAMGQSDHPNILSIYEVGRSKGFFFFSMPLVHRGSLANNFENISQPRESESARQREQRLAALVEAIARGVHHGHQRGILHLDLKPANILIHSEDRPLIADFGLARLITQQDSEPAGGTANWMAPEQADGQNLSTATDIYAIGRILYTLLESGSASKPQIPPPDDSTFASGISQQLREVLRTCQQADPTKRYPSALTLAEDLERFRRNQPIRSAPPGFVLRSRLWIRRNPGSAQLIVLLAACLILASGFAWNSWRAALEHDNFVIEQERGTRIALAENLMRQADQHSREGFWSEAKKFREEALLQSPDTAKTTSIYRRIHEAWQATEPFRLTFEELLRVHIVSDGTHRVAAFAYGHKEWKTAVLENGNWSETGTYLLDAEPVDAAFSTDGAQLWVATVDGLRVLDYKTGKIIFQAAISDTWQQPLHRLWQSDMRIIPIADNRMVEIGKSFRIWDTTKFELIQEGSVPVLRNNEREHFWKLDFNAASKRIALAWWKGDTVIWDLADNRWLRLNSALSHVVTFNPDGQLLAVGEQSGVVTIYNTQTGDPVGNFTHNGRIESLAFSPSARSLVSGSRDRTAQVWELPLDSSPKPKFVFHHPSAVLNTMFLKEDELFTSSEDQILRHFELKTGALIQPMPGGQAQGCAVKKIQDNETTWLVLDQTLNDARFYLLREESVSRNAVSGQIAELSCEGEHIFGLVHYPELAVLGGNRDDPQMIARIERPLTSLWSTTMDAEQRLVGFGHTDGWITLVDRGGKVQELKLGTSSSIARLTVSDRHGLLIAITEDSHVFSVDLRDPSKAVSIQLPWFANSVALHPEGKFFAIADRLGFLNLRDTKTLDQIARTEKQAHRNMILTLKFSSDGRSLASGGMDKSARVWSIPELTPRCPPLAHRDYVWELAFARSNQELITGGQERLIRRWDIQTGLLLSPPIKLEDWPNAFSVEEDGAAAILNLATSDLKIASYLLE